jgi:hypothetical protein
MGDICSRCKEHCEVGFYGSDDGYDAAREAFNNGYGPAVTRRQRWEEQEEADEFRRSGW